MTPQRRSYWKTLAVITLGWLTGAAAVIWLALAGHAAAPSPAGYWLRWLGMSLLALVVLVPATMVLFGGLLAVHRDRLEERGVPYATSVRREWVPGPLAGWIVNLVRKLWSPWRSPGALDLRAGDLVEVKSAREIATTLDRDGALDGLPFMPEMASFCGRRLRVFRRIDKLNDWVNKSGRRRVRRTVLLEGPRCTGSAHGGCQANCHIRWNEAWLRRVPSTVPLDTPAQPSERQPDFDRFATRMQEDGAVRYVCQATELAAGTSPLEESIPRQFLRELLTGNVRLGPFLVGTSLGLFNWVQLQRRGIGAPSYHPQHLSKTPHEVLNLRAGELVRVKNKQAIEQTLNAQSRNRGLWFDADMLRFCGGEYRVLARIEHLIVEKTGTLITVTNPCAILEAVTATGEYAVFNPENESIFWREIWLERVGGPPRVSDAHGDSTHSPG